MSMRRFTWKLKDPSSLKSSFRRSDKFEARGFTWSLVLAPIENNVDYLSLSLDVTKTPSLCSRWRTFDVEYSLILNNKLLLKEGRHDFKSGEFEWRCALIIPFAELYNGDGEFLANGAVTIVAEVVVSEMISASEFRRCIYQRKSSVMENVENVDVNGLQVLPFQVESLRRMFEKHPDIEVEFEAKNQRLRKACMGLLFNLIETLCQSLEKISNEKLVEADLALTYVKDAGFKVDWLEKKLEEVKEKKEKELSGLAKLQETEENLLKHKQKCAELVALAEEQKAELSATRTSMSFDDVV